MAAMIYKLKGLSSIRRIREPMTDLISRDRVEKLLLHFGVFTYMGID